MDSLTQATLGAAVGEAVLGREIGNKAALFGAIIGTIPDLDVILTPFFNELQKISLHRGYSHSLLFCFLAAFLLAYVLKKKMSSHETAFFKWWLFSFLCLFTHVLLDTFTSYGTQLFLPFTDWRVSFDSIGIIDPFYTIPLLAGVLLTLFYYRRSQHKRFRANIIGLSVSTMYLVFTLVNKQYVNGIFQEQLEKQNIQASELLTVPVKVGNAVWYGVAKEETNIHIGKYSHISKNQIEFHRFPINEYLLSGLDTVLVDRMKWFSKGFYAVIKTGERIRIYNLQCDMQGIQENGEYRAPTAFYFEITPKEDGEYDLSSGMHR